ncbi:MAG: pyrroloquinoline-quinone synthase PqqC [Myxococcales bacterium]|nr:pyrroloquinoline-quinone synthase PqqC [Myxococcales bacterium]
MNNETSAWTRSEFEQQLRGMGRYYHIYHPFHRRMNSGNCTREEIQCWVANRYYYQRSIPIKDAAIMANCDDPATRRLWVQRILDHDGTTDMLGGLEAWVRLGEAVGLLRSDLVENRYLLPGVQFACDAYVNFARRATWQEAACSSLTELFAPRIHQQRLEAWPQFYPWIELEGYTYFQKRLSEARRDVEHGLSVTLDYFCTRAEQEKALDILRFKLQVLWSMLDAMQMATEYGHPPFYNC